MAYRFIRPFIVKAYIGGQHDSWCDSCAHQEWCKSYKKDKRVFYCDKHYKRKKHRNKKKQAIITQSEEERLCEVHENG
jgi:adenine-specific DNA glycosylase